MADWKKLLDDAVSTIGDGVQAAGDGLRGLADDARKVAGIGRGGIEIVLPRARYGLGGTIAGTVRLTLSEPVPARRLVVALRATRRRNALGNLAARGRESSPQEETVFEFESNVGGEQTYESGEHRFAIDIPAEIEVSVRAGGLIGEALRAVKTVDSLTHGQLRWRVLAWLDIAWKRNLSTGIDVVVREGGDDDHDHDHDHDHDNDHVHDRKPEPEPGRGPGRGPGPEHQNRRPEPPPPPPPRAQPPARPSVSAAAFRELLAHRLEELQRRGVVVIHDYRAPPIDPAVVMAALARHPDLDAELLQFYGVMDGLEIVVAQPRVVAPDYDTIAAARAITARNRGRIGCLGELHMHHEIGPALTREFCDDTLRVLEIPTLERLLDDSEDFPHRDGRNVVFGAVTLGYGDDYGITHADEIRSWRQPPAGQPGRDGTFDHYANEWQAELRERESSHRSSWCVVHGEDHGAGLCDPKILRWGELLALCLQHLAR